ncbi:hypothetical protein IFR04_014228 [Cadophora malorum]|uniref:Probable beta-glucosidase H n=1 Tax=Cadophora malorum TaxID=108018 RepID=A0A8H7T365_9HELO|nr:hypothetical protein IFR04_014228 [Cadophora malorum]
MTFIVEDVLKKLTVEQKVALLTGLDWWHTYPIEQYNVPSVRMSDGPTGIRGTKFFQSVPGAALPCGTALAATWDKALLGEAGQLLGKECIAKGVHCWLGPTVNITRSPLGGRNAEAFSEDPHLTGVLAAAIIAGCQSTGVISTIKHFVCNDQEDKKYSLNAVVTQRALREIYLRPFQIAARDANPGALMTAYNKVNGFHCSEHPYLEQVVRAEWKWDPLIMSDWFGTFVGHTAVNAGLDLEMPGKTMFRGENLKSAIATLNVKQSVLDQRARRVLEFVRDASDVVVSSTEGQRDFPEDRALNRKICGSTLVLLKNDNDVLPIPKKVKRVALIGSHMQDLSILGLGSNAIEPYYTIHPFDAIKSKIGPDVEISYEVGVYAHRTLPLLNDRSLHNCTMYFFNEPVTTKDRTLITQTPLNQTYFQLVDFFHPKLNPDLFYASIEADFVPQASGIWDFGLSCCGTADLFIDDELVIDNTSSQTHGNTFLGEGTVEEFGEKGLVAGKTYKIRLEFGSAATSTYHENGGVGFGGGGAKIGACPRVKVEEGIRKAEKAAAAAEYTIICTGLSGEWEGEGNDRASMSLPPMVDTLIWRVAAACPKTTVVNLSGGPVSMPWASQVPSIIQAWYGGNEAGNGIADVLFGDQNPCGKLPMSWPHEAQDDPTYLNFGNMQGRCLYGEDIYVGYRYYDKIGRAPRWSFGHGLSYTTFKLSDLVLKTSSNSGAKEQKFPQIKAVFRIENTGSVAGAEVVQLYVAALESNVARPTKELHGFEKCYLEAGESREVEILMDPYAMSYWDEIGENWCIEEGKYQAILATTSRDTEESLEALLTVHETTRWLGL